MKFNFRKLKRPRAQTTNLAGGDAFVESSKLELVSLLARDGRMLVGLYSERSRQDVIAARAFIAERGYAPTAPDIRRCRQDLMSFEGGAPFSRLAARADFYVTGECRDLLFHVEEHRFTIPEIARLLAALALRFDGFLLNEEVATRYRDRYPDDPKMDNLDNWDCFEAAFPYAFSEMYIFWVQKDVTMSPASSGPESSGTSG